MLLLTRAFSQNENANWYFGNHAGLNFMTGPPTVLTNGALNTIEGSACISDPSGNLLFYSDGVTVYNQAHMIMANGSGLAGNQTATQAALILKQPGSASLYYVFSQDANGTSGAALYYSVVDMSLAAGMGSVTVKNILIAPTSTEKVAAATHCNGRDFWILTHEFSGFSTSFKVYALTSAGLNLAPVISSIGTSASSGQGYLQVSPTMKKIASVMSFGGYSVIELFDFNNTTGSISNSNSLYSTTPGGGIPFYGCEFSPDGSKLYGGLQNTSVFYQWDLNAANIVASRVSIGTVASGNGLGALMLGPDNKIYTTSYSSTALGVINNPNISGTGCGFVDGAQSLNGKIALLGLPNRIPLQPYLPPLPPFTYTTGAPYACQTAAFNFTYAPGNASLYSPLDAITWNFNDPVSGTANTSTLSNPTHVYTNAGTYTVQLAVIRGCRTDTLKQQVVITQPCVLINHDPISCASPGSATITNLGSSGPYSYTWMPVGQTGTLAIGLGPGTYTISIFDAAYNMTFTTSTVLNNSGAPITGNVSAGNVNCNGAATGTATVTNLSGGSGNQHYLWTGPGGAQTTPVAVNLSAGSWTALVTDAVTGCQLSQGFSITQPPAVTITLSADTPTACAGADIVLSATVSGGTPGTGSAAYTYSWANGPATNTYAVSENAGGSYSYTLTGNDANACSVSQVISVTFVNNPTLTVSNVSVCPQQTGTLTASGATSYTWNTGSVGNVLTGVPLSSQQYTVTGSTAGCSAVDSAYIFIKPAPSTPVFFSNSPVCEAGSLSFSCTAFPGYSYAWAGPNGFISAASAATIQPVPLIATGVYDLTVTAANSCTAGTSGTVIIKPLPTLTISPASPSICAGTNSITLSALGTATLFAWQPNQYISSTSGSTVAAYPNATQAYTLHGTLNGCSATATTTVHVIPPPNLNVSLNSVTTCAQAFNGSPNTIVLTAGGAFQYTISTPNHILNSNPNGPITNLSTLPPHNAGVSTATVYGSNGACTLSTTAIFTIIPNPTVTINSFTPFICAGESFTYTNAGADSYTWTSSTPGQSIHITGDIAVANPSINAVFSVSGGSIGCNSAFQTSTLSVYPLPTVSITPNPAVACINGFVTLHATGTGDTFSWSPSFGLSSDQGAIVNASPPSQQNYTVTAGLNSCTSTAMVTVLVVPAPNPVITAIQTTVCLNQLISMQASGGTSYSWMGPDHHILSGSETLHIVADNFDYSGIYTLTAFAGNGCAGTNTVNITVKDIPYGYLKSDQLQGCAPFCGNYQFKSSNYPVADIGNVNWKVNGKAVSQSTAFGYCFSAAGNYILTGDIQVKSGCINTVTLAVTAHPQPKAEFSYSPEKPVENFDAVNFTSVLNGQNIKEFNWYFLNNAAANRSNQPDPAYLFQTAGAYPVALIVRNEWGCSDSTVRIITVEPDFNIFVPNAFTPNDDGRNDLFFPVTRGSQLFNFEVFDRWGQKIFSTTNPEKGWDGTYKGEPCQQGVYVWKIEITFENYATKHLTGFVTMYR